LCYAYSPTRYEIAGRYVIVKRLIGEVRIPLGGIRQMRLFNSADCRGCIRLWGSGGLFGYYGLFRTKTLGRSRWYVTNRKNRVVVVTGQETAVFSPDNLAGFQSAIRAAVPVPETPPAGAWPRARQSKSTPAWVFVLPGVTIGLVVAALVTCAVVYAPGPPKYTLTATSLSINDRFYPVMLPATAVDLEHIRVVDISTDPEWRPTERTNGFANSHYHSGWFRAANGSKVRMYWATARRLVLLPPKDDGVPVLLEIDQPDRFVEDVQQLWSGHS
jgi:hypothetical protein